MERVSHFWVYLQTTPLLGLAVTLSVYAVAAALHRRLRGAVWANPVMVSILALSVLLVATGTPYAAYFQGAQYVHFLLGPATVALALPMYANMDRIRRSARAILPAILAGSLASAMTAVLIAWALGAPRLVVLSLAPKSVTTPIAMGIAEQIGGQPSLAAIFVLLTGLVTILLLDPVLHLVRVANPRARGLAAGTAGHGLATAHILPLSEVAGAFAGLAIGLNGLITAVLVPLLVSLLPL